MGTLDHEKLDIYQHALTFVADAQRLADDLPGKRGDLGDQLRRASTSIALNIAEGAGEFAPRERRVSIGSPGGRRWSARRSLTSPSGSDFFRGRT